MNKFRKQHPPIQENKNLDISYLPGVLKKTEPISVNKMRHTQTIDKNEESAKEPDGKRIISPCSRLASSMAKTMGIFTRARLAFPTSSYVCRLGKFLARIPLRSGCELFYVLTHQTLSYFKVMPEVENKVPEMILPVMIVVYGL